MLKHYEEEVQKTKSHSPPNLLSVQELQKIENRNVFTPHEDLSPEREFTQSPTQFSSVFKPHSTFHGS